MQSQLVCEKEFFAYRLELLACDVLFHARPRIAETEQSCAEGQDGTDHEQHDNSDGGDERGEKLSG